MSETTPDPERQRTRRLERALRQAAQIEHVIADQYLFAAFSLKKFPEEFGPTDDPATEEAILAEVERNRRREAMILFTARQEMEHLCMVQNLLALVDRPPFLWRPNFPVPRKLFALGVPFRLQRFARHTIEVFRYYEKPDTLDLPSPFGPADADPVTDYEPLTIREATGNERPYGSIEELYGEIHSLFRQLLENRTLTARNPTRIVNEHFGFNIELRPLVQGKALDYVTQVKTLILEQGEGVGDVPPPLGSHFMAFQNILDELSPDTPENGPRDPALPVVDDPYLDEEFHPTGGRGTRITHPYTRDVVRLFNDAHELQNRMLTGFFAEYDVNQTTGVHPPRVNAYFQTAFYPMMTMVVRPLAEIVCRLPAFEGDAPRPGHLPKHTAGPSFEYPITQRATREPRTSITAPYDTDYRSGYMASDRTGKRFAARLAELGTTAAKLAGSVPAGFAPLGGASYESRLTYLAENLDRMSVNFLRYWNGKMVTVIPSHRFQNLPEIN